MPRRQGERAPGHLCRQCQRKRRQAKELCNKRKIAFYAKAGTKAQVLWNQSGRSKAAKIKEAW
jgi:hypothetical protein